MAMVLEKKHIWLYIYRSWEGKKNQLRWPFLCPVRLTLVDQQGGNHISEINCEVCWSGWGWYYRLLQSTLWGAPQLWVWYPKFIDSAAFVQDNCIIIKAEVEAEGEGEGEAEVEPRNEVLESHHKEGEESSLTLGGRCLHMHLWPVHGRAYGEKDVNDRG